MSGIFETDYTVTAGRLVRSITAGIILLFIVLGTVVPISIYLIENLFFEAVLFEVIMIGVSVPVVLGSWAFSPQKYSVSETELRIVRPAKTLSIPLNTINKVEQKELSLMKTVRSGNGGLFSITGKFYNKSEGWFRMYTKNDNFVLLHGDKKVVLSPDDRELFIQDVKSKIERLVKKT